MNYADKYLNTYLAITLQMYSLLIKVITNNLKYCLFTLMILIYTCHKVPTIMDLTTIEITIFISSPLL